MASYEVLYWHDIPVQVRARGDGGRQSKPLATRFQEAVDLAASAAGLINDDDYTAQYRWADAEERDGSARDVADTVAAELEAQYATIDWRATAASLKDRSL